MQLFGYQDVEPYTNRWDATNIRGLESMTISWNPILTLTNDTVAIVGSLERLG